MRRLYSFCSEDHSWSALGDDVYGGTLLDGFPASVPKYPHDLGGLFPESQNSQPTLERKINCAKANHTNAIPLHTNPEPAFILGPSHGFAVSDNGNPAAGLELCRQASPGMPGPATTA